MSNSGSGAVPMSLQGILYQAMSEMSKYDIQMMKQQLQYMIQSAREFGGWSADGKTLNINNGIVGRLLTESKDSAEESGTALKDEAYGQFAAAGSSLFGFGLSAGFGGFGGGDSDLTAQVEDTKAFQGDIEAVKPASADIMLEAPDADTETVAEKRDAIDTASGDIQDEIRARNSTLARLRGEKDARSDLEQKLSSTEERATQLDNISRQDQARRSELQDEFSENRMNIHNAELSYKSCTKQEIPEKLAQLRGLQEEKAQLEVRMGRLDKSLERDTRVREEVGNDVEVLRSRLSGMRSDAEIDRDIAATKATSDQRINELNTRIDTKTQEIADKEAKAQKLQERAKMERRIQDWTAKEPDLAGYTKDRDLNQKALAHLKLHDPEGFNTVQRNVNIRAEKLGQSDRETRVSTRNTRVNLISQLSNMGSQAAQAGGHVAQGDAQVTAGKEKALADVLTTTEQQWTGQLSDTKQRADGFLQDANSVAAGYASITQTRS